METNSRLDRLFVLLSSGSGITREAAAFQLGNLQASNPQGLSHLLTRLTEVFKSREWEARIAGSVALSEILKRVELWNPSLEVKDEVKSEDLKGFVLDSFDLESVLERGTFLRNFNDEEEDEDESLSNPEDDVSNQRRRLSATLGLDQSGIKSEDLISNEDLIKPDKKSLQVKSESNPLDPPAPKKLKVFHEDNDFLNKDLKNSSPLEPFVEKMYKDLFNEAWEIRHGAATALREVIRHYGPSGGMLLNRSKAENSSLHREWLQKLAVRLVCVIALDRFGDFVADTVVAPVRETGAQALSYVLKCANKEDLEKVLKFLLRLLSHSEWQCRHGGLLGIKYLLAARVEDRDSFLSELYPSIFKGLTDDMDDVVSVAASSLLPVTDITSKALKKEELSALIDRLWDSLLELDDLATSTHSLMRLLSQLLISIQRNLSEMHSTSDLKDLVPRIYPLLSHSSSLVRQSALEALETLTSREDLACSFLPHTVRNLSLHLFQRSLIEHSSRNLELIETVWRHVCDFTPIGPLLHATCPLYGPWLILISQPPNWPLQFNNDGNSIFYLGGPEAQYVSDPEEKSAYMMRARILACRLLGYLAGYVVQRVPNMTYTEDPMDQFVSKILYPNLINTRSAYLRTTVCLVISEWESLIPFDKNRVPKVLKDTLVRFLTQAASYDETISAFTALQNDASDLLANLRHYNVDTGDVENSAPLTYEQIQKITEIKDDAINRNGKIRPKVKTTLIERKQGITDTLAVIKKDQSILSTMTLSALAGSAIAVDALPEKLHPVIKPLMESIKKESNVQLQNKSALKLAEIMDICSSKNPTSNDKVIKNLGTFVSSDSNFTPSVSECGDEIITVIVREKNKISSKNRRQNGSNNKSNDNENQAAAAIAAAKLKTELQKRGAVSALQEIVKKFGNQVEEKLPKLWDTTFKVALSPPPLECDSSKLQEIVNGLQSFEVIVSSLHADLFSVMEKTVIVLSLHHAKHPSSAIRHLAARVVAEISAIRPRAVMTTIINSVIPALEVSNLNERRGAIEIIACILDKLGVKVVPYVVLLLVPVLGRMSDSDSHVRLLASNSFASLVRLMPLDGDDGRHNGNDEDLFSPEILERKRTERKFISQLMNAKNAEHFDIPTKILDASLLRPYQQSGVNWLAFLNRYKLHGILCDDMGLGKTLQSICILAGDHYERKLKSQEDLPSLVICPTTLGGHWKEEILKFVKGKFLSPLLYTGSVSNRSEVRKIVGNHNVVISSYDIVRKDVDFFKGIKWNYIVLDEGHVIKNAKTKTTLAVKLLISNHRLILSGTPIQNSVLEIWSLFDFLMPGYLGSEREFSVKFSKPILASREPKCSKKDLESGALATESLHRQILPFVLRRMKEDVLKDLPPKITQDYYCDLSPLQVRLYEEYTAKRKLDEESADEPRRTKSHVFQALQYLRKVCNHPKLVSQDPEILSNPDISVSAKLPALKDLLHECGIGVEGTQGNALASQHRALIFFQLKSMIDIVEKDLLKILMPSVTYLRLDGSVPSHLRHDIVHRFNTDVSIDLLLLSTSVGGLGLNLTGADTVIFAEHDWNPMKDLQAMDRAHRIGQKKVVNVYRLITRSTIEEKILGLQKFKLKTANTVISSENSSLESMATDQIFDLFSLDDLNGRADNNTNKKGGLNRKTGLQSILQSLPELWDDKLYEEEYNLDAFMSKNK